MSHRTDGRIPYQPALIRPPSLSAAVKRVLMGASKDMITQGPLCGEESLIMQTFELDASDGCDDCSVRQVPRMLPMVAMSVATHYT